MGGCNVPHDSIGGLDATPVTYPTHILVCGVVLGIGVEWLLTT